MAKALTIELSAEDARALQAIFLLADDALSETSYHLDDGEADEDQVKQYGLYGPAVAALMDRINPLLPEVSGKPNGYALIDF